MIPYEDLVAALEAYVARTRGTALPSDGDTLHAHVPDSELPAEEPSAILTSRGGEDDATSAGMQPVYEDRSNELDINDVLTDDEN
jgi:hypothetical protein